MSILESITMTKEVKYMVSISLGHAVISRARGRGQPLANRIARVGEGWSEVRKEPHRGNINVLAGLCPLGCL